jgi:hypothetical protein
MVGHRLLHQNDVVSVGSADSAQKRHMKGYNILQK